MREDDLVAKIAKLPPMTVTAHPLFMLILAMALPEIVNDEDIEEWRPWLRPEAEAFAKQVYDKVAEEAMALARQCT